MSNIPRPSKKELTDFELSRMRGGRGRRLFNEKAKNRKKTFSRLIKFLVQDKLNIMLVIMFVIITSSLSLLSPIIQSEAIDSITLTEEKLNVDFDLLYKMLTLMGIVFVATCTFPSCPQFVPGPQLPQQLPHPQHHHFEPLLAFVQWELVLVAEQVLISA